MTPPVAFVLRSVEVMFVMARLVVVACCAEMFPPELMVVVMLLVLLVHLLLMMVSLHLRIQHTQHLMLLILKIRYPTGIFLP